jgi:hypothetical protein
VARRPRLRDVKGRRGYNVWIKKVLRRRQMSAFAVPSVGSSTQKGVSVSRRPLLLDAVDRVLDQAEASLGVLSRAMQPRHRAHLLWQRCPAGDGPSARPRLRIVANPGKPPTQLDHSRQLALLVEDGADRSSISLGDDKHPRTMAMRLPVGKRGVVPPSLASFVVASFARQIAHIERGRRRR